MRKFYRRRLITVAMMAFAILLLIIVSALFIFSYVQTDRTAASTVELLLNNRDSIGRRFEDPAFPDLPEPSFMQRTVPSAYYDITAEKDGTVLSCELRGFPDDTEDDIQAYVVQLVSGGKSAGRLDNFRYGVRETGDGSLHIVLMDITIQLQMLYSMLRNALIIGAAMLILLLVILLPVTSRAAARLARNTETQKQFITDAGHELKTPVAVMRSNLDVMELLQGKSKWSGNIRYQVDRLEALVKQLLLMARADEKQAAGKTEPTDFSKELETELGIYDETALQKNIKLKPHITEGLKVNGDQECVRQLIHALIDNALQYTQQGGDVRVKLEREKRQLCLEITNSVDALPQTEPERLLDRFTRGDTARARKNGGTGIGLSTVKSIAEMYKGSVSVAYPDDKSFRVTVRLPLTRR